MQDQQKNLLLAVYELRNAIMDYCKTNHNGQAFWGKPMTAIVRNIKSIEKQVKNIFFTPNKQ